MHLSEFKAWFEGFTEDMNGPPNKDQWARIRKRVKEITADYTPTPIFIDRYVTPYHRYWYGEPVFSSTTWSSGASSGTALSSSNENVWAADLTAKDWQSAGRAELLSMKS